MQRGRFEGGGMDFDDVADLEGEGAVIQFWKRRWKN
jgi:hypothetical protein